MNEINCNVCRDLLPLYVDGALSEDGKSAVENHLVDCLACREQKKQLEMEPPIEAAPQSDASQASQAIKRIFKRRLVKGVLIGVLCAILLFVGGTRLKYMLFDDANTPIGASQIAKYTFAQAEDGRMLFSWDASNITRGYAAWEAGPDSDDRDIFYITPLRSIMEWPFYQETQPGQLKYAERTDWLDIFIRDGVAYEDSSVDWPDDFDNEEPRQLTDIRLGTPEDYVQIWKPGTVLPPANEDMLADYRGVMNDISE
ncbi:zf-HC2 domain-containing protein [Eubacteriales bacterium OttesenSCG-928-N13]|nr:zf-HC2 domain-containing protein [Eubacteriales bacterium OttesenSCG-928-N13]